jgi:hypothetical protein
MALDDGEPPLRLREIRVKDADVLKETAFGTPPRFVDALRYPFVQRRIRQRIRHSEAEVIKRKRGGESKRVKYCFVRLSRITHDKECADVKSRFAR